MTEFEDRFSQINIGKSPTRRKKAYPQHLYPTPTRDSEPHRRTPQSTLPPTPQLSNPPHTPSRAISNELKSKSTINHQDHRIISYPMSEQQGSKKQFQFSFMRETWSSQQKKNIGPLTNTTNNPLTMSKPVVPTRKRSEQRKSSQTSRPRRLASNTVPIKLQLSQATNILSDFEISSPTKPKTKYHHPNAASPIKLPTATHFNPPTRTASNSSDNVFNRLYPKHEQEAPPRTIKRTRPKISNIPELYNILSRKQPDLFKCEDPPVLNSPIPVDQVPMNSLNIYERGEIIRKSELYYVPTECRTIDVKNSANNFGFDDNKGHYIIIPQDHINYRFQILDTLGNGSFGNVILAKDHKLNSTVAVKVINNNLNWSLQAVSEIKLLKLLNEKESNENILRYITHFNFRSHMCIATELLSLNLYTLLELTNFQGLSIDIIKIFTKQILNGIQYLHKYNIIHCDIKPENIMIKLPSTPNSTDISIKLIDFGSACYTNETSFTYIQSRFYRAPEVILGSNYNEKIDIWSFGCVITELFMGSPLFPGKSEIEQVGLILELLGSPKSGTILRMRRHLTRSHGDNHYLENSLSIPNEKQLKRTLLFKIFDINGKLNLQLVNSISAATGIKRQFKVNSRGLDIVMGLNKPGMTMSPYNKSTLLRFLGKIFIWDPIERAGASELLQEPFLL
ncbi:uncharacterized protein SPAPADRAFT_71739 [Spathaspora passalidarum NRRL Y-27907]|uniref:Protein kinase domain-containing protein n=1 Tax=Spathaspora passalidarum (strain NRRL Y-27907 / 11-Y1) TaxID=619300 RepID=G3APW4_SPAPN|nr:uncharacterized protein SPAPADRAFT_71739 [Spathaspora passalidarum NRRL Y-27907]EGW32285.1 hypothetical protein SPAPADRAFT_71739 [Spathaspora passalidarum NRRL Y-27907]